MPKLSQYVAEQRVKQGVTSRGSGTIRDDASFGVASVQLAQQSNIVTGPAPEQTASPRVVEEDFMAAAKKFKESYSKRVREHGARVYRWPDGELRAEKPLNSYAVANRRKWAQLVLHCRTQGGDRIFDNTGRSFRHNINVSRQAHEEYLSQADLLPETDRNGTFIGFDEARIDPLSDPDHALNSFYKDGADAVFAHARGRLL